jgi:glycerophosphoryl diester phosphodiesterase
MLVLAHRGYHLGIPENTLEAFHAAVSLGADGIETDVRRSAEGAAILFHDRLVPDGRAVSALTGAELTAAVGYPVPTLESALEMARDLLWNVEIKSPDAVEPTLAVLKRFAGVRRLLVTSFWHPVIEEVSARLDVPCGLLVAHRPLGSVRLLDWLPRSARVRAMVWEFEFTDGEMLAEARGLGLRNYVYGANAKAEQQRAAEWGADGVITDEPWLDSSRTR